MLYTRVSKKESPKDGEGTTLSTKQQEKHGIAYVTRENMILVGVYTDDESASAFARRGRAGWERLVDSLAAGEFDVLVLWEPSRATRDMTVWVGLADLCKQQGVKIVANGRMYDPADPSDLVALHIFFILEEYNTAQTSLRVQRDTQDKVVDGQPGPGKVAFGYHRAPARGATYLIHDTDPRTAVRLKVSLRKGTNQQTVSTWTAAGLVQEIFASILGGNTPYQLAQDLNLRGIPNPRTDYDMKFKPEQQRNYLSTWYAGIITFLLKNPVYLGKRRHYGALSDGKWEPLVDNDTFYGVANARAKLMVGPKSRPQGALHLLSRIAICTHCQVAVQTSSAAGVYGYRDRTGSIWIPLIELDSFVTGAVLRWLTDPDNLRRLRETQNTADEIRRIRGELEELQAELRQWRDAAHDGQVDLDDYKMRRKLLIPRIETLETRLRSTGVPPVLKDVIGPNAVRAWADLHRPAQRAIISNLFKVEISRVGRGQRNVPIEDRVRITEHLFAPAEQ